MAPELIALALALPLPVRLALLDADPTGAGWAVYRAPATGEPARVVTMVATGLIPRQDAVKYGAAWLPCNPLAIVEHAARLKGGGAWLLVESFADGWRMTIVAGPISIKDGVHILARSEAKCPHTAAVALLREVVGG